MRKWLFLTMIMYICKNPVTNKNIVTCILNCASQYTLQTYTYLFKHSTIQNFLVLNRNVISWYLSHNNAFKLFKTRQWNGNGMVGYESRTTFCFFEDSYIYLVGGQGRFKGKLYHRCFVLLSYSKQKPKTYKFANIYFRQGPLWG